MTYAASSSPPLAPNSPRLLVLLAVHALVAAGCPDGEDQVDSPTSATEGTSSNTNTSPTDPTVSDADGTTAPATDTDPDTDTDADTQGTTGAESASTGDEPGVCGDGQIDPGEQCDDGPVNADDAACTSACMLAACGDGLLHSAAEECDDGLGNAEDAACTPMCTKARCGDGMTQTGVEECDDGDGVNEDNSYGVCTTQCTKGPRCGDGELQPEHEECDDGEMPDVTVCLKDCMTPGRQIFVSSSLHFGDLGGTAGADHECRTLAFNAGLLRSEKFRAWLSSDAQSPLDWELDTDKRYQLPSGKIVATNWSALVTGTLQASINQKETQEPLEKGENSLVWTGTLAGGSQAEANCEGWTKAGTIPQGWAGLASSATSTWTELSDLKCNTLARIYCVEVW